MNDASFSRLLGAPQRALRVLVLTMAAGLLVSCSGQDTEGSRPGPERGASVSTSPGDGADRSRPPATQEGPADASEDLPTVPATRDGAELARQVERAVATIRDRGAAASDVRRAGELQQLAVLTLAGAEPDFRREALARMDPQTARATRSDIRAARLLRALTSPQPTLPRWRIVAPPPAEELLGYYREAQRRTGVPWYYLAAIHLVETRMGRIRGTSSAGARGPMQFLPSTWEIYGGDGDINDPRDAILAAARLLEANGAPGDMAEALYHYNPSDNYVGAVSEHAGTMRRRPSAYRGYRHWRVLYRHTRGTHVLPVGYPQVRAERLSDLPVR